MAESRTILAHTPLSMSPNGLHIDMASPNTIDISPDAQAEQEQQMKNRLLKRIFPHLPEEVIELMEPAVSRFINAAEANGYIVYLSQSGACRYLDPENTKSEDARQEFQTIAREHNLQNDPIWGKLGGVGCNDLDLRVRRVDTTYKNYRKVENGLGNEELIEDEEGPIQKVDSQEIVDLAEEDLEILGDLFMHETHTYFQEALPNPYGEHTKIPDDLDPFIDIDPNENITIDTVKNKHGVTVSLTGTGLLNDEITTDGFYGSPPTNKKVKYSTVGIRYQNDGQDVQFKVDLGFFFNLRNDKRMGETVASTPQIMLWLTTDEQNNLVIDDPEAYQSIFGDMRDHDQKLQDILETKRKKMYEPDEFEIAGTDVHIMNDVERALRAMRYKLIYHNEPVKGQDLVHRMFYEDGLNHLRSIFAQAKTKLYGPKGRPNGHEISYSDDVKELLNVIVEEMLVMIMTDVHGFLLLAAETRLLDILPVDMSVDFVTSMLLSDAMTFTHDGRRLPLRKRNIDTILESRATYQKEERSKYNPLQVFMDAVRTTQRESEDRSGSFQLEEVLFMYDSQPHEEVGSTGFLSFNPQTKEEFAQNVQLEEHEYKHILRALMDECVNAASGIPNYSTLMKDQNMVRVFDELIRRFRTDPKTIIRPALLVAAEGNRPDRILVEKVTALLSQASFWKPEKEEKHEKDTKLETEVKRDERKGPKPVVMEFDPKKFAFFTDLTKVIGVIEKSITQRSPKINLRDADLTQNQLKEIVTFLERNGIIVKADQTPNQPYVYFFSPAKVVRRIADHTWQYDTSGTLDRQDIGYQRVRNMLIHTFSDFATKNNMTVGPVESFADSASQCIKMLLTQYYVGSYALFRDTHTNILHDPEYEKVILRWYIERILDKSRGPNIAQPSGLLKLLN